MWDLTKFSLAYKVYMYLQTSKPQAVSASKKGLHRKIHDQGYNILNGDVTTSSWAEVSKADDY